MDKTDLKDIDDALRIAEQYCYQIRRRVMTARADDYGLDMLATYAEGVLDNLSKIDGLLEIIPNSR